LPFEVRNYLDLEDLRDDIVVSFSKGDKTAFDVIYYKFSRELIFFCRNIVSLEDAQDIVADTFYKLWNMRDRWDSVNNLRAFLYVTARNACFDLLRREKMKAEKEKRIAELLANEQELILMSELKADLFNQVIEEIENLPNNCREVFKLAYLDGYETNEIAEKLSIAPKTVFNLLSKARNTIRTTVLKRGVQVNTIALMLEIAKHL
jgi:RNA polymerase sigma-70 factor (ECF subfamily)